MPRRQRFRTQMTPEGEDRYFQCPGCSRFFSVDLGEKAVGSNIIYCNYCYHINVTGEISPEGQTHDDALWYNTTALASRKRMDGL